jgi:hypothetical protein
MRLADQPEYRTAIPAAMCGDYAAARSNLQVLISRARDEKDLHSLGHLLQTLGDVEARTGNEELGHKLHMEAVELDADSPYPLLRYAQGLLDAFKRADLAKARLADAEAMLNSKPSLATEELPRSWYQSEFERLRKGLAHLEP